MTKACSQANGAEANLQNYLKARSQGGRMLGDRAVMGQWGQTVLTRCRCSWGWWGRTKGSRSLMSIPLSLKSKEMIYLFLASSFVARSRLWGQIALDLDPSSTSEQLLTLDPWMNWEGGRCQILCTVEHCWRILCRGNDGILFVLFRKMILAVVLKID